MTGRERMLAALAHLPVDRLPVWMMRQAGRYLPGYQALRREHSFMEMVGSLELSAEISMEPVRLLDVDAAIVFHDILIPYQMMGCSVDFVEGQGPVIDPPIRTLDDVDRLVTPSLGEDLVVVRTLLRLRELCGEERALIGFAGAPFTMATYGIEGAMSKTRTHLAGMLAENRDVVRALLDRLAPVLAGYLIEQARGADVLQIFESHADILSHDDYADLALPALRTVVQRVRSECPQTPLILFGRGLDAIFDLVANLDLTAVSLDADVAFDAAAGALARGGARPVLQGNFPPEELLNDQDEVAARCAAFLNRRAAELGFDDDSTVPTGWVVNLGHGVLPQTAPVAAKVFVETVHGFRIG